jgi:phage-related protein
VNIDQIRKVLHDAVIDVKVVSSEMKILNKEIEDDIAKIFSEIKDLSKRISDLESYVTVSTSIYGFFSRNWWKIFPFFITIFGGIVKLMVFLRNLPPSN